MFVGLWGHLVDFFPDSLMPSILGQAAKVWWSNHNVRLLTPQMFGLMRSSYPKCVVCQDPYHFLAKIFHNLLQRCSTSCPQMCPITARQGSGQPPPRVAKWA